jgi:hypothetical protein
MRGNPGLWYSQKFMLSRHQPPLRSHSALGENTGEAAG